MSMSISGVTSGAVSSALQGISNATAAFNGDAQAVASSVGGDDIADVAGAMVDMSQQSVLAQLDARVLAMSEKMLGSLLDVTA